MTKRLIVNADDYGRTPAVSRGILQAHGAGIVTSTTVMINQPGIREQLAWALEQPGLGLGLHLVFSAWQPVLSPEEVPNLVDGQGAFLDQHTLWAQAAEIPPIELRAEFDAQVQRFATLAGRLPDHLDCHHFVHLYPPFFQAYADLAARLALPLRIPFPLETEFEQALSTLAFLEGFPHDLVQGMIVTDSALVQARHLVHPDRFVGTFFGGETLTLDYLLSLLDALPPGTTELMCHPGYVDEGLASSSYRAEREIELALLTHPAVRQRLDKRDIELTTFGALR